MYSIKYNCKFSTNKIIYKLVLTEYNTCIYSKNIIKNIQIPINFVFIQNYRNSTNDIFKLNEKYNYNQQV